MESDARSPALISGRFRLGELLGTGGSASVFAAVDTRTDVAIALKILHPHLAQRPAARGAFLAEAGRMEHLRHPNIVGVIDVGVDESSGEPLAWIAVERAEGRSLSEHVARCGALEPAQAVSVLDGILRALGAAHAVGLVHRDVSPANIMVTEGVAGRVDPRDVRLLDFGLADAAGRTTVAVDERFSRDAGDLPGVVGNVNYLSPEQARGDAVDARGDIYQAGAVLYFALTGRAPFARETAEQTMRAHVTAPPPVPSVLDARIPRELDRVVVRAMLKDPSDRFGSAEDMRTALTRLALAPDRAWATLTTVAPSAAAAPTPAGAATRTIEAVPSEGRETTRVLGRTVAPPREAPSSGLALPTRSSRTGRAASRHRLGGLVALAVTAAAVTVILVSAASTGPTAVVEARPLETATAVAPQVSPEPLATAADQANVRLLTLPDLAGLTLAEAQTILAQAGFTLAAVVTADSPRQRESVLSSEPAWGSRVRAGTTVAITVASGFNAVPEVAGQGRDAAAALMQGAGFPASFAPRAVTADVPAGSILGSDPAPGTSVAVGTPVTVWEAVVAAPASTPGPAPTRPLPSPTSAPTPSRSP